MTTLADVMPRDAVRRRAKLAKRLEKLEARRTKLAEQAASADEQWRDAIEADADTSRAASQRRALALDLEDVTAEAEQVAGWIADIDAAAAAAAEVERRARDRAEALARLEEGTARLAELVRTDARMDAIAAVRAAAETYRARATETAELEASMPALAQALGVPWTPPQAPRLPDLHAAARIRYERIRHAVPRGVEDVALELGEAVKWGADKG